MLASNVREPSNERPPPKGRSIIGSPADGRCTVQGPFDVEVVDPDRTARCAQLRTDSGLGGLEVCRLDVDGHGLDTESLSGLQGLEFGSQFGVDC